jgi:hypothetical protein
MTVEYANRPSKRSSKRPVDIERVPAFRRHLDRENLESLAEWEARQKANPQNDDTATDRAALSCQAARVALNRHRTR